MKKMKLTEFQRITVRFALYVAIMEEDKREWDEKQYTQQEIDCLTSVYDGLEKEDA